LHGDAPPLLVVPLGSANLMGQHLGLKWETRTIERQIIDAIRAGHTVALDTATANDELFLLIAGVGIDGRIVHELTRVRRGPLAGKANYLLPAAVAISKYRYPRLTVSVDGKTIFEDKPAMAFVGNVREYGTGFPLLPLARSDDGLLDVCVTPCANPIEAARLLLHSVAGDLLQVDGVVYAKGTRVRVESPDPVEIQLDGDAAGHTPLDVALLPRKLRFIVPRSP
ncbi:MAG: diacylglycerol/lipid kinase family protein, partial [Tepidisphaeraceae bacterium]